QHRIHHRTGDGHDEALPAGLGEKLVRLAAGLIHGVFAGHLDVAAEGEEAEAVVGAAGGKADQALAEAQRKGFDPHAKALGGEKMAQLVYKHDDAQHHGDSQRVDQNVIHRPTSLAVAASLATSRAWRSNSKTAPILSIGRAVNRCRVSSTTDAMAGNPMRPAANSSKAVSSAALRMAPAPPPALPACRAKARQGKALPSGSSKSKRPISSNFSCF